jgi:hypothetical protein
MTRRASLISLTSLPSSPPSGFTLSIPIYLCAYIPIYLHTCISAYLCLCTCIPIYLHTCVPVSLLPYAYMPVLPPYLYTSIPLCLYTFIPIYLYTCNSPYPFIPRIFIRSGSTLEGLALRNTIHPGTSRSVGPTDVPATSTSNPMQRRFIGRDFAPPK